MKNTMDFNNKTMQDATVAVMNDILASDANGSSMDDLYSTVCKYVNVSKEQFNSLYAQAEEKLNSWKNNGSLNGELSEDDLDMVVGGSVSDFLSSIANGIADGAKEVGNFVKEHAAEIAIVAGFTLMMAAPVALIGAMAACAFAAPAAVIGATAAVGAIAGGAIGFNMGLQFAE